MRFLELRPTFIRHEVREGSTYQVHVADIASAQGVRFLCPKCFRENGGAAGTHSIVCWSRSRGISDDVAPRPGRWTLHGTGLQDLTLHGDPVGSARSVLITGGCNWHGYITNGETSDA